MKTAWWPSSDAMEKLIDAHFQQLIDKLDEILTELKTPSNDPLSVPDPHARPAKRAK